MNLLEQIEKAGLIGCGGAGFPTHVKLNAQVTDLIINAAECEPLLRTDRYIMKNKPDEIVEAVEAVGKLVGAQNCTIALKSGYTKEIAALEGAISARSSSVKLHKMNSFYPAGDEQVIVNEVTGRVVPPAGIPLNVGCVISNVATMLGIYDAMHDQSFTDKYLTVTGAVEKPVVLKVPIGTSFRECIEKAGGVTTSDFAIINGGPMMGKIFSKEEGLELSVTKTTSGILVIPEEARTVSASRASLKQMLNRAKSACIQCTHCTQMCPRHMLGHPIEPHKIMRKLAVATDFEEILDDVDVKNALICCECGVCEIVACPMTLNPRRVNGTLKMLYGKNGVKYQRDTDEFEVDENREYRKVPTKRAAARAGVLEFNKDIEEFDTFEPDSVRIKVKQNIGAPPTVVVSDGQKVKKGDLIAKIPEGALSANLHASVSGTVTVDGDSICIKRGE